MDSGLKKTLSREMKFVKNQVRDTKEYKRGQNEDGKII